jgi:tetratricopeptide (TPR) repeat protein
MSKIAISVWTRPPTHQYTPASSGSPLGGSAQFKEEFAMQFAGIRGMGVGVFFLAALAALTGPLAAAEQTRATTIGVGGSQADDLQGAAAQPQSQADQEKRVDQDKSAPAKGKTKIRAVAKDKPAIHAATKPASSADDDSNASAPAQVKQQPGVGSVSLNAKLSDRKPSVARTGGILDATAMETAKPISTSSDKTTSPKSFHAKKSDTGAVVAFEAAAKDEPAAKAAKPEDEPQDAEKQDLRDKKGDEREEALKPIPATEVAESEDEAITIEAASFSGVVPGVSTKEDVDKAWGASKETAKQENSNSLTQLYSVGPFKHVELNYADGKVSSVVIRFEQTYPAATVAKQLDLTKIRPVLVSSELGEVLGVSYPERGVLFAFEPSKEPDQPSMKVTQIILEPISAEPFILRAETTLDHQPNACRRDLEQALTLEYGNARTHWLYSRVLVIAEDYAKAIDSVREAVRLEPDNPRYRVTQAQILGQLGRFAEAVQAAQKAAEMAEKLPHVKARALCLQGDLLASGPEPNYRKAIALHTRAIQTADPLTNDPHPAIRIAAKETLIDSHLGAAHDIAWGDWKEKEKAAPRWLERAAAVADDLVENEGAGEEHRFHAHARTLAVIVGIRGSLDPAAAVKAVVESGETLITATEDPARRAQHEWDLGMALYDALQISQMRSESAEALKYGEAAVEHFEKGRERASLPANALLLGRLYFRIGAIHVTRDHDHPDHREAVVWFDKAIPWLDRPLPEEAAADVGRHGETLVSMGVSYWEVGQREKAVGLTQKGIAMMEHGVRQGSLDRSSLAVPYHNLAAMHRQLGSGDLADHFQEMATRLKTEKTK